MRFWVVVASREHVSLAVAGSFCQAAHGKLTPLRRLSAGDRVVYYAPRVGLRSGDRVQAFVALGEVSDGSIYRISLDGSSVYRRSMHYREVSEVPVRPLLERLSMTRGYEPWGFVFRRSLFEITASDHDLLAALMTSPREDIMAPRSAAPNPRVPAPAA